MSKAERIASFCVVLNGALIVISLALLLLGKVIIRLTENYQFRWYGLLGFFALLACGMLSWGVGSLFSIIILFRKEVILSRFLFIFLLNQQIPLFALLVYVVS